MRIDQKYQKITLAWLLCIGLGFMTYQLNYTPTKCFVGFWSGQSAVNYGDHSLSIKMQLVVDDAKSESARLIVNFEPNEKNASTFHTNVTSNIQILNRSGTEMTFSLTEFNYTNKKALEAFIDRELPSKGVVISGVSWATSKDEIFLYLTLPFGEKMGVVLRRHN